MRLNRITTALAGLSLLVGTAGCGEDTTFQKIAAEKTYSEGKKTTIIGIPQSVVTRSFDIAVYIETEAGPVIALGNAYIPKRDIQAAALIGEAVKNNKPLNFEGEYEKDGSFNFIKVSSSDYSISLERE